MSEVDIAAEEVVHADRTYSIEAEDLMVARIFYGALGRPRDYLGFYVDIGAFDPVEGSNTYHFYKRGWSGVNVEPNPKALKRFQAIRPRDVNLGAAIGPAGGSGKYFSFDDPMLNGLLDQDTIEWHIGHGCTVLGVDDVPFCSVENLLSKYVPAGVAIDYLNIDVEMMEHRILSDWDFSRWRPTIIAVEIHGPLDILEIALTPVATLLRRAGYTFISRLWHTSIFMLAG